MIKKYLLLGIVALFSLVAFSALGSANHDYHYYGYHDYSETYYKKTSYDPYGKTTVVSRESPYRSYYSSDTKRYGGYAYPNRLYGYFSSGPYYSRNYYQPSSYYSPNYGPRYVGNICYGPYC